MGSQWLFFRVNRVPIDWTITDIESELRRNYPLLSQVQPPRWLLTVSQRVLPNKKGEAKKFSSIIITIGIKVTTESLGLYSLGLFSQRCKMVNFYSAPPGAVCKRCFGGSHSIKHCSADFKCSICAGDHAAKDHRCETPLCRGRYPCKHNMKCTRCGEDGHRGFRCTRTQPEESSHKAQVPTLPAPKPITQIPNPIPIEIEEKDF